MAVIDLTTPIGRIRMAIGDFLDVPYLTDTQYQDMLDSNNQSENAVIQISAGYILMMLSFNTRCRLDRIETYGNQAFENYLKALKETIRNPAYGTVVPYIYAAGVYVEDVLSNQADAEVVQRRLPIGGEHGEYTALTDPSYETF